MAISLTNRGTLILANRVFSPGGNPLVTPNFYRGFFEFGGLPPVAPDLIATSFTLTFDVQDVYQAGVVTIGVVVNGIAPLPGNVVARNLYASLIIPIATYTASAPEAVTITVDTAGAGLTNFNHAWRNSYRDTAGDLQRLMLIAVGAKTDVGQIEITGSTPTLTVASETSARTGIVGHQYVRDEKLGIASGMVECHKSGRWVPADEAVIDGYTRMPVHRDEYDPPERFVGRKRPRPTSLEK